MSPKVFRVFTRNIFLGADLTPLLSIPDFSDLGNVAAVATEVFGNVQSTNFPDRVRTIAREIRRTNPQVIGLQEVAQYVLIDAATQRPVEIIDWLDILETELAKLELHYERVIVRDNTTALVPLLDLTDPTRPTISQLLNFTLRDAMLVRGDLNVIDTEDANYDAKFFLGDPADPGVVLKRGWSRVTLNFRGVPFNVFNTHLEIQGLRPVNEAQGAELLGLTQGLEGVTIIMGDLNSDAEAQEGDPSFTDTYGLLTGSGFVDAWEERLFQRLGPEGFTCCHDPDLRNRRPTLDERIDFVLVRTPGKPLMGDGLPGAVVMSIQGDDRREKTATGLWPSDHAGLFAGLRLPYRWLRQQ